MSTVVVVIGPQTTAGSKCTSLAINGNEQPTNLEIIMVTNNVDETNKATSEMFAYKLPAKSLTESVLMMPTHISNISQPNENTQTMVAMIEATLNSFQITRP